MPEAVLFPNARLNLTENLLRDWPKASSVRVMASGESGGGIEILSELTRDELIARVAQFAALSELRR